MSSSCQLWIFSTSLLILLSSTIEASMDKSQRLSSVSYKQASKALKSNPDRRGLAASDLAVAANSAAPTFNELQQQQQTPLNYNPQTQPSIYHSIIDRTQTAGSTRQLASPVQATTATVAGDLQTAAGHHHGHGHGKYYEYREVPKKKTWKFGYKRGNHKHTIERHEHGKAGKHPHFKTKVKWHDKKSKGKGIHLWDYNHHDKKHGHHG